MTNRKRADAEAADVIRQRCELLELAAEFCRATSKELEPAIELRPPANQSTVEDSFIPGVDDTDLGDLHLASMFWSAADLIDAIRILTQHDPYSLRPMGALVRSLAENVGAIWWISKAENAVQRQARSLLLAQDATVRAASKLESSYVKATKLKAPAEKLHALYRETGYREEKPGNSGFVKCIEMNFDSTVFYFMFSSLTHPDALFTMQNFITSRRGMESTPASLVYGANLGIFLAGSAIDAATRFSSSSRIEEMNQKLFRDAANALGG